MLERMERILTYTSGGKDAFLQSEIAQDAVIRNFEIIGEAAKGLDGKSAQTLSAAYDEIEDEEDEHLYHTKGWCRELWLESLGLDAVLPPPEETEDATTAVEAAQAKESADAVREAH